jgi:hypothetical protein
MTRWLLVLGLLSSGGACSFALTGPDAKAPKSRAPGCDTSKTLVVLDMVAATIAGVSTLAAGANHGTDALAPGLITALFAGSALHGNSVVQSCRRANDEYLARATPTAKPPPAIAEESADEDRPPPRVPPAKTAKLNLRPEPAEPVAQEAQPEPPQPPVQAPKQPAQEAPRPVPPPIEVWVDFWKEIR